MISLPDYLTRRIAMPVRWDGQDLLDANNRIIVWGKEESDDKDDIDVALGYWVAQVINELWASREAT
jgi:hypothetical protein